MSKANSGRVLLHILPTSARRTIDIHFDIAWVNIDFSFIHRNLRQNFHQREGCVSAMGRIKRGKPHQTMHTFFRSKISEGIFTIHSDGHTFNARFFTLRDV